MNVQMGNEENFNQLIENGVVVVDFFATWCGPCKMLGPVLEDLSNDRSEVKFVKIDVDQNQNLAKSFGIMSVPTLLLFKDGQQVSTKNGFLPKEALNEWIEEYK